MFEEKDSNSSSVFQKNVIRRRFHKILKNTSCLTCIRKSRDFPKRRNILSHHPEMILKRTLFFFCNWNVDKIYEFFNTWKKWACRRIGICHLGSISPRIIVSWEVLSNLQQTVCASAKLLEIKPEVTGYSLSPRVLFETESIVLVFMGTFQQANWLKKIPIKCSFLSKTQVLYAIM